MTAPRRLRRPSPSLELLAPAKVNLLLRVLGKRPDGYHLLESLVAPVSLFDTVSLRPLRTPAIRLGSTDPSLPVDAGNLAWRAAAALRDAAGVDAGVAIRLRKRIPAGAGLGGGSSDAAAVLVGLNRLWKLGLESRQLAHLGQSLGADVPFFVHGLPAIVRGIGERVRPCRLPPVHLVLVWPRVPVSTAWVYANLKMPSAPHRPSPIRAFLRGSRPLTSLLCNDLEDVTSAALPAILDIQTELRQLGALATRMSGSGSAVFGIFPSAQAANRVAARLRRRGHWSAAVRTLGAARPPRVR